MSKKQKLHKPAQSKTTVTKIKEAIKVLGFIYQQSLKNANLGVDELSNKATKDILSINMLYLNLAVSKASQRNIKDTKHYLCQIHYVLSTANSQQSDLDLDYNTTTFINTALETIQIIIKLLKTIKDK